MKNQTISLLLNVSTALEQAIHDKDQRIHAVYPQVLPGWRPSDLGKDLMDPLGMVFIASGDAYLRLAKGLIDFLVTVGKGKLKRHDCDWYGYYCDMYRYFGLDHSHFDDIFHNYKTVIPRHFWDGYRGAALAPTQEEARSLAKERLRYDNTSTPLGDLPSINSMDMYDAVNFIAFSDHISGDFPLAKPADDHRLGKLSSGIGDLIQDDSALIYTLLGGGDDSILLYGTVDAHLRLAKGLVDFVLAAQIYRNNHKHNKPILNMDFRNIFDLGYSVNAMNTVCLTETQAELNQARVFFRLE